VAGRANDQHRSDITGTWRRLHPTSAFIVNIIILIIIIIIVVIIRIIIKIIIASQMHKVPQLS